MSKSGEKGRTNFFLFQKMEKGRETKQDKGLKGERQGKMMDKDFYV